MRYQIEDTGIVHPNTRTFAQSLLRMPQQDYSRVRAEGFTPFPTPPPQVMHHTVLLLDIEADSNSGGYLFLYADHAPLHNTWWGLACVHAAAACDPLLLAPGLYRGWPIVAEAGFVDHPHISGPNPHNRVAGCAALKPIGMLPVPACGSTAHADWNRRQFARARQQIARMTIIGRVDAGDGGNPVFFYSARAAEPDVALDYQLLVTQEQHLRWQAYFHGLDLWSPHGVKPACEGIEVPVAPFDLDVCFAPIHSTAAADRRLKHWPHSRAGVATHFVEVIDAVLA